MEKARKEKHFQGDKSDKNQIKSEKANVCFQKLLSLSQLRIIVCLIQHILNTTVPVGPFGDH